MQNEFEMSMMGELNFFLGLQIKQTKNGIFINQSKYCKDLMHMLDVVPERIIPLSRFEHNRIYVFEEAFYVAFSVGKKKYGTPVLLQAAKYIKNKLPVDPSLPKINCLLNMVL